MEKYDICTQYIALTPYMLVQKVSLILGLGRISGFGARPDTKFNIRPDVGFLCSTGNKVGHQAGYPVLVIDRIQNLTSDRMSGFLLHCDATFEIRPDIRFW